MTVWEKFISDILANYKKEDIICQYYTHLCGGNKGTKCSKRCPFRQCGGKCVLYGARGGRKKNRSEIEEILSREDTLNAITPHYDEVMALEMIHQGADPTTAYKQCLVETVGPAVTEVPFSR